VDEVVQPIQAPPVLATVGDGQSGPTETEALFSALLAAMPEIETRDKGELCRELQAFINSHVRQI
jgi:hypothetical protein